LGGDGVEGFEEGGIDGTGIEQKGLNDFADSFGVGDI
jgi:hypothetical protein